MESFVFYIKSYEMSLKRFVSHPDNFN